jgi:NodT family efflux transporter outer membrane factor (OMF) lipoprotein
MDLRHTAFAGHGPRLTLKQAGRISGALGLLPMLVGCFVDTEKPELKLEVPDRYLLAQGEAAVPSFDWWRGFHSAELTRLMEEAQTANFDIAVAIGNILQANAQVRTAGAALLPDASITTNVTRSKSATLSRSSTASSGKGGGGGGGAPPITTYQALGNVTYVVDFWGQNRAALLTADENAISKRYAKEVVVLTTISNVANDYFQVLGMQDRIKVAKENIAASSRILGLIRERMTVGTASSLEVSQQEALVAGQRASIPPLEITLRQTQFALALLMGRAPEHFSVKGGSLDMLRAPRVTPGLPSELLNQRPDIREAEATLRSTNHSVESARAAFFPSIQLTGQAGYESLALASLFGPSGLLYSAVASATQPIFDGGTRLGQLELAQGQQIAALQTYRKSVISAFTDVENALIALQQQITHERLQMDAVKSSREAFNISETRLREGTLDQVTLLNTQETLFAAEDLLVQARLAKFQAIVSLFQALGGGWPPM